MSLQAETFEALCSALYRMPFAELLGETEEHDERVAWFHLGTAPKDMRVAVIRPLKDRDEVSLKLEWRNYFADARNPLKCGQTLAISTYAADLSQLAKPTEVAMLRVLEVYQNVLSETGVAGAIEQLAPVVEESEE